MLDNHAVLCLMFATQFISQWLKRMTLKLLNTSLTTILTQQQSQLIRTSDWFIKSVTTTFKRLSFCNQFFFMFKYDFKVSYIILSNDESDNYVLFADSENNCDAHNFWKLKHRNHSQSFIKNWVLCKQQSHH